MDKYIIITGGDLFNKGAQAMTYITVEEMAKRFPDCTCVLLSNKDVKRSSREKENYKFIIKRRPGRKDVLYLTIPLLRFKANKQELFILQNTVCQIDISGYALGSNWGIEKAFSYIRSIRLAKKYKIPVFLMSQSFGPFEFKGLKGLLCSMLIGHYLKYPKVIMAREEEGFSLLKNRYHLNNIIHTTDIVLQKDELDLSEVLNDPEFTIPNILNNSVALIPNSKNNKYGSEQELLKTYIDIIDFIKTLGKNIYLIYHSAEDRSVCETIYASCGRSVYLIEEELSCMQFDKTVKKFDYVIASRFHSVVYAYKNCVPAIILGWATKYNELARQFKQSHYQFDVRSQINTSIIIDKISSLNENYQNESKVIREQLEAIQCSNPYDYISLKETN